LKLKRAKAPHGVLVNSRVAIFISGRGSNLKSFLDSFSSSNVYVFSNKKVKGLDWAAKRGCHFELMNLKKDEVWHNISDRLNELKISKLFLLGFMKIIPAYFLESFKGKVINLHPSLLPAFPGLNSIEKSLKASSSVGVSLHEVNENMDEGPLIFQSALPEKNYNDLDFETDRVHSLEQQTVSAYVRLREI